MVDLAELGWNIALDSCFRQMHRAELVPARVTGKTREFIPRHRRIRRKNCIYLKSVFRKEVRDVKYPVVGDWVGINTGNNTIEAVLPRKSKISRQVSGGRGRYSGSQTVEQVVAANIDIVFITGSLDGSRSLNPGKIERYLALARASEASPVIILNKMDLCADLPEQINVVKQIAPAVPVLAISATWAAGLERLKQYLIKGSTAVFLGSSGVGKSSIINALLGAERLKVSQAECGRRILRATYDRRPGIADAARWWKCHRYSRHA